MSTPRKATPKPAQPSMFGNDKPASAPAATPAPTHASPVADPAPAVAATPTPAPAPAHVPAAVAVADAPPPAGNGQALAAGPVRTEALVVVDDDNPWDLSPDELAEVIGADGLGDVSGEDFRIGYWVFNVLNRDVELEDGTKIKTRRDQWWNTLTNRVADVIEGVFLGYRKTHMFDRYNNKTNKTERFCRSNDRVTGTALADFSYKGVNEYKGVEVTVNVKQGDQRPCAGCPQQEWRTIKDPETNETRQKKDCSLLRSLVFYETASDSPDPGVIRFKRSSARAVVDMLSRHFLGKWKVKVPKIDRRTGKPLLIDGKPIMASTLRSYPLYAFKFQISLALDKSGNYAVPEFKKVGQCTHDEIMYWMDQAKFISEMSQRVVEEADKQEAAAGVGAEDEAPAGRSEDPDAGPQGAADDAFDTSRMPADDAGAPDADIAF